MRKLTTTFKDLIRLIDAYSGEPLEIQLQRIFIRILEMEDVLFHLNSCVMMPEAPGGPSSSEGAQETTQTEVEREGEQRDETGIRALALAYRQLEWYPHQGILLAGHTDTSGGYALNFSLSDERARNVQYLLEGQRRAWAELSEKRHKIEDYQQILAYLATNPRLQWPTDPGPIDDRYGDKTETAIFRFIESYNQHYADRFDPSVEAGDGDRPTPLSPDLVGRVRRDPKHRWPVELWQAVFDLYMEEMADALDLDPGQLPGYRNSHLRWADKRKYHVACGESFPIDSAEKNNYRSQKNRRVEVLFFDEGEAPVLDCPAVVHRAHVAKECPIWHKHHYKPIYLDRTEVESIPYHMKFLYFDNVHGTFRDVPKGLKVRAFGKGGKELRTRTRYYAGVYTVQVPEKDLDKDLYFGFECKNQYVYSADESTSPVIKTVAPADWEKMDFVERYKHYDLPSIWYSKNYYTRYDGDVKKGKVFAEVLKSEQIKPHGGKVLARNKPLMFCLDDIVLLDRVGGTQQIKDRDGSVNSVPLKNGSRIKVLCVDPATSALKLYQKQENDPKSARIPFRKNLVTEMLPYARIILFREEFFIVARKRTEKAHSRLEDGDVVGARAAVMYDRDHHYRWVSQFDDHKWGYTGDFDTNFFHHLHVDGKHPTSYLVFYVSMSFLTDSRITPKYDPIPSPADVKKFVDIGVYDSMEHWNHKRYWLEEESGAEDALRIRPLWFFEEKETFVVVEGEKPNPGWDDTPNGPDADDKRDRLGSIQTHACVTNARGKALGGQARFLASVCRDDNAPKKYGLAYHWAIRDVTHPFSVLKLNKSAWEKNVSGVLSGKVPVTEYGHKYGIFTLAHELGHAVGHPDEYINEEMEIPYTEDGKDHTLTLPAFDQFFECYTMPENVTAMMYENGAPRLHYLWFAIRYLQDNANIARLSPFIKDLKFTARFQHGATDLKYTRNTKHLALDDVLRKPFSVERQYQIAASPRTRVYLSLHFVGQDEASIEYFHTGQTMEYQAVLCVRPKLRLTFVDSATENWTGLQKATAADKLDRAIKDLTGKYRLKGGTKDIQNIFVNFLGGFTPSANAQLNHQVRYYRVNHPLGDGKTIVNDGGVVRVGKGVGADKVVDVLFNRSAGQSMKTALGFLKTWVDAELGESFTLEEI